jgi:hypothetical protein
VKKEYLTQQAQEQADKNLVFYTSDWDSQKATQEARGQQKKIDAAIRRGERTEILEGARRGAQKTLTNAENTRIRAENDRRQREYDAAVKREQERYQRELDAYNRAVAQEERRYQNAMARYNEQVRAQADAERRQRAAQRRARSDRAARIRQIKNKDPIRKLGRKIGKIFGW